MTLSENELFDFGTVVGVHGLRGELKVAPHTPASDSLISARSIFLRDRNGAIELYVPQRSAPHKGNLLLRLEGVESVEQARMLVGFSVLMQQVDLPQLPVGRYYWHQLQGLAVFDRQRGDIGFLQGIFSTAAHDIYEVNGPFGEVLIPVVDQFIIEVDLDGKRIQVDLPEGLIPESDEN